MRGPVPVDAILGLGERAADLDFREGGFDVCVGNGFELWRSDWLGERAGWGVHAKSALAMAGRNEPLVLTGWLPEDASFPAAVEVSIAGTPRRASATVDAAGVFEVWVESGGVGAGPPDVVRIDVRCDAGIPSLTRPVALIVQRVAYVEE